MYRIRRYWISYKYGIGYNSLSFLDTIIIILYISNSFNEFCLYMSLNCAIQFKGTTTGIFFSACLSTYRREIVFESRIYFGSSIRPISSLRNPNVTGDAADSSLQMYYNYTINELTMNACSILLLRCVNFNTICRSIIHREMENKDTEQSVKNPSD